MLEWITLILLVPLVLLPFVVLFGFAGCDLFFPLRDPLVFKTTFEITFSDERILENACLIVRIEADRLSISGTRVQLVLERPQTGDLNILAMYISQAADPPNDPYDAPVTPDGSLDPTRIRLGNPEEDINTPLLLSPDPDPANALVVLAPVDFVLDEAKPLLIAINLGSSGRLRYVPGVLESDAQSYRGPAGLLEAAQAERTTGYISEPRVHLIRRIEVS